MKVQGKYCRICTRTFYGSEYEVKDRICQFCQIEIDKGQSEEWVAIRQQRKLAKVRNSFRNIKAYNKEFND